MVFTLFKLLDVKSVQSVSFATNFFTFFATNRWVTKKACYIPKVQ